MSRQRIVRRDDGDLCTLILDRPDKLNALDTQAFEAHRSGTGGPRKWVPWLPSLPARSPVSSTARITASMADKSNR
jgi:hypothetical protein